MEERDFKEYIVKLNDRNIQRKRESGFTLYAILGVLILCFGYILDNLNVLHNILSNNQYLILSVIISNLLFSFSYFYFSYSISKKENVIKIQPYPVIFSIDVEGKTLIISFLSIAILNFFSLIKDTTSLSLFYLLFFGIITGINAIFPIIYIIKKTREHKENLKNGSIDEIIKRPVNANDHKKIITGTLIYATVTTLFSFFEIYLIDINLSITDISSCIKYILIYYAILLLIKIAIDIKNDDLGNKLLEEFEKDIFFESLSNQEILNRYESEFSGIPLPRWFDLKKEEINSFFIMKFELIAEMKAEVDNINEFYSIQEKAVERLNNIKTTLEEILEDTKIYVDKLNSTFSNLLNNESLDDPDIERYNEVIALLQSYVGAYNKDSPKLYVEANSKLEKFNL